MTRVLSPVFKVAIASMVLTTGVTMGYPDLGKSQGEPESAGVQQITNELLTITGELSAESEVFAEHGSYYNIRTFNEGAGQTLSIEMKSNELDPYLILLAPNRNVIAQNNDGGGGSRNSRTMNQPALLTEAEQLDQRMFQLYQEGHYTEATLLGERALEIRESVLGENHPAVAISLNNLAELYRSQGNYTDAEAFYQRSLSILETTLGENDPLIATNLNNLGELYRNQGNYADAETLHRQALSIREEILGEEHPDVATSLNNLALLYHDQGNYTEAEPLYQQSLSILKMALGENDPLVASSLNNLAALYHDQGQYADAEIFHQQALSIREEVLGENHPDVATSLNNLAELYRGQGNYADAEILHMQALSIREEVLGENHPDVATSLSGLAFLYHDQGNYADAEPLYTRSLSIVETALGENHPLVAASLNNLAGFYQSQGNYADAEPLYTRSLSIVETALGDNHPNVATSLNNLANLYREQGNYVDAEFLLRRALSIRRTALGENHPDVAASLNSLALLYQAQGNYAEAELLYRQSLPIYEAALGKNHPDVATSLNNLAELYRDQGNYTDAELLHRRSLSIYETALGGNHPNVATSLVNLASLSWATTQLPETVEFLRRGLTIEEVNLDQTLSIGSEIRKQAYIATLAVITDFTISFDLQATPTSSATTHLALETILHRKGRVFDAVANNLQQLRQNLTADSRQLFDNLQVIRNQLVALHFQGLGNQTPEAYQAQLNRLETTAEELANTLAQRSAEFRAESTPVTIAAIQAQIPNDAVLIEFFRYQPFNPTASPTEYWGSPRYAAYILHPDGIIHGFDLGETEPIDQATTEYLKQLQRPASINAVRTAGRALDDLILHPLRPHLGTAQHLLISLDGQLNLIPFAALVDENDQYLIENYTLTTLASGRDLLKLQFDRPSQQAPVIVANPNLNAANPSVAQIPNTSSTRSIASQRSTDLATLDFAPLPGTQIEAEAIAHLLPNATLLTGADATEAALTQLNAPSILHLATHGYFLNDVAPIVPSSRGGDGIIEFVPTATPPVSEDIPLSNENPLLRSGLALANFNPPRDEPGNNDGVLSALEVSSLNLYGTDLVVLSACQTGVGDVVNGEGVYGLRRAFALAGAESLLMSLWKVDDYGTAELMRRYYERLINDNEGRSEALRQVQLELMNAPAYEHPYYWAAFMLSGDWRPLNE